MKLSIRDLHRLRRAHLGHQRALLRAQFAQQGLGELVLELERRYNLLGSEAIIDVHTGAIAVASEVSATSGSPASEG